VTDARRFFEDHFTALSVADGESPEGLFTGYYEPELAGSRRPSTDYRVPILRRPDDLVGFDAAQEAATGLRYGRLVEGEPVPYFTRKEIEQGALEGRGLEIVWLKDWTGAFFIHIQGSGRVRLEDGGVVRLAYSLKSGLPYTAIGAILVDRGVFTRDEMSMQAIRGWMAGNEQQARELMWENQSFVFFREITKYDPSLGPPGAQDVPLTPQRSLAIDRSLWTYGTPVWIDTAIPDLGDAGLKPFRSLMIAQDTGSAIRGAVRGDVFWGSGEDAERVAGHMKSPGRMVVLLPNRLARRLARQP
jgi:membrane-bound lytic murein transglycosylase A